MVKNIFIISAPKWFKIAYKVLAIFLTRKLRERVRIHYVSMHPNLSNKTKNRTRTLLTCIPLFCTHVRSILSSLFHLS